MTHPFYRRIQPLPEFERGQEVLCQFPDCLGRQHTFRGKVNTLFWDSVDRTYRYYCLAVRAGEPGFMAAESMLSSADGEDQSAEGLATA